MNRKLFMVLSGVASVHAAAAVLLLGSGCVNMSEESLPKDGYVADPPVSTTVVTTTVTPESVMTTTETTTVDIEIPEQPPFAPDSGRVAPPVSVADTGIPKTPDITYKVQSGDTLDKIANRYGVSATMLAAYNGIANKNIIRKGQTLKIPSDKAKTVTTTVTTTKKTVTTKNTSAPALSGTAYVVKSGDSLGLIAAKHGVKLSALMAANGIKDANKIVTGRKLVIPAGGKAPSVRAPEKKVTTKPAASGTETKKPVETAAVVPPVTEVTPPAGAADTERELFESMGSPSSTEPASQPAETTSAEFTADPIIFVISRDMTLEEASNLAGRSLADIKRLNPQYSNVPVIPKGTKLLLPL